MMNLRHVLLSAALGCFFSLIAGAAEFKIVANPSVEASAVSAEELKGIFLITRTSIAGGSHVQPVIQKGGPTHEALLQSLGKSDAALQTYYRSLVFTGKGSMPKSLVNDAEVVSYVAKTKGAVGYVSSSMATSGVKVLDLK